MALVNAILRSSGKLCFALFCFYLERVLNKLRKGLGELDLGALLFFFVCLELLRHKLIVEWLVEERDCLGLVQLGKVLQG
jgi:hypothetical protein